MKKINIKIVLRFLSYFIFFVAIDVLQSRYRSFRGAPPYTWAEIFNDFWVDILFCLIATIVMMFKSKD